MHLKVSIVPIFSETLPLHSILVVQHREAIGVDVPPHGLNSAVKYSAVPCVVYSTVHDSPL